MFEGFDGWLTVKDNPFPPAKPFTVTEFIEQCNFTLNTEYSDCLIEGEVASFKINQNKWVFFDLKEGDSSISCFMVKNQLTIALTDGMKVRVLATPKLTRWGKFSLTVRRILPVGEGNIKKSFELLKQKLTAEGLFDPRKKRPLPERITTIGVISSTSAAGYIDFLKILDNRWGGLKIKTINTQVQGLVAPEQIIRALQAFNEKNEVDIIAILRGGGSADDLSAFNDEALARTIAASKLPVITGIGHEIDESLADLAADIRASTPSNAAERLTPDKTALIRQQYLRLSDLKRFIQNAADQTLLNNRTNLKNLGHQIASEIARTEQHLSESKKILFSLNPENVLKRGYAIISGKSSPGATFTPGEELEITTFNHKITTEVKHVETIN